MIVPELNFDIYLGSPFIQSKDFLCYDGRGIYLSPDGQIDGQPLRNILSRDPQVIRTDVHYMSRKSYSRPTNAVRNITSSLNIGMTMDSTYSPLSDLNTGTAICFTFSPKH